MSTIDDKLNEVLDIAGEIVPQEVKIETKKELTVTVPNDKDPDIDFETGRKNLYNLLDKGNEAIDGILSLAKEGEHPRAYEVAGQLIKHVADTTDKLIDLQKKMKDLDADEKKSGPSTVNNTMFIGSTADLQKMLKKQKEINNTDTN